MGSPGSLPEVYLRLEIKFFLLRRLVGVKSDASGTKADKVRKISEGETLMINVGSTSTGGRVTAIKNVFEIINSKLL